MEDQNIQIVQECIEQITNRKQFEHVYDYYSKQCVFHSAPYVGLGILMDDSSGEKILARQVVKNGPASGLLQPGDELLAAVDAYGSWQGYEQLSTRLWGQGKLGTAVKLTLLRDGKQIEVTVTRGWVEGFRNTMEQFVDIWKHYLLEEMPDTKVEIQKIIACGDTVAYYSIDSGTSKVYNQSAIWSECNILRLEDGKIVEWWGVEDTLSQWHQFGFRIIKPG